MGWVGWQKKASEVHFWVRCCAGNYPLEIPCSPHSHFLDAITEVQEEKQLLRASDETRHVLLAKSSPSLSCTAVKLSQGSKLSP